MPRGFNILDEARLQNRLWAPNAVNAALWLDASDFSTITTDTNTVTQWADKSGNSRNAVQTTSTARPLLIQNTNNVPIVRFDGVDDFMTINSEFFPSGAPSNISFIIVAAVQENNGGFGGVITTNPGLNNTGCGLVVNSSRNYNLFPPLLSSTRSGANFSLITAVARAAVTGVMTQFFNGVLDRTGTYTTNVTNATTTVLGKYRVGDTNFGAVDIAELIVVTNTSSQVIQQQIEGYIAWKWGLQTALVATHPFANRPPLIGD